MKSQNIDQVKKIIKSEKPNLLKKYGVSEIGVFGSFAFGDFDKDSDIDILVKFKKTIGLFKFIELEDYLAKKLGRKVDLVTKDALKEYIRKDILNSTIYV